MAFIDAKRAVSFPLEDKHVMNEHHIVQNSYHDATQKKMSSSGAFQCTIKLLILTTYSQRPICLLLRGWGSIALLLRGWASMSLLCMWGKTNWRLTCRECNILSFDITKM